MEIGTIFTLDQYAEAYEYVTSNSNCKIEEIEPEGNTRRYQIVAIPEPTVEEKNEQIKQKRAGLYAELIDPLHAERQRKVVLGTWTEEMEAEYVEQVKALTAKIQEENPYIE